MTSTLGLAADNVLEMEVVTADGHLRTLSPTQNSMRGGGAGTFDAQQRVYWDAVDQFHAQLPSWVDLGGFAAFILTQELFFVRPLTFPGKSQEDVQYLLDPLGQWLDTRNITYSLNITESSNFLEHAILRYEITAGWNYTAPFAANALLQQRMTTEAVLSLEQVTPGSGTYLNEANFQQPNWQDTFYGSNYARLLEIKERYDPESLFYATTAVGSEA
ncbi:hypothetical protein DV737_g656, partial [Chaetothyriales sp. CBS 132003]